MNIINSTKDTKERISRLLEMHANQRKEREEFYAGDIAACVGLKKATTGDTLCAADIRSFWKRWSSHSLLSTWLLNLNRRLTVKS